MAGHSIEYLTPGDTAPDFELPGADGETYELADFIENDALLLVFTCNHCPYAKAKISLLNDLAAEYDDLAVVGINPNDPDQYESDSFERMQELVESGQIQYDGYCYDESQVVARAYGAVCTPDPYLFWNVDGTFELAYHGRLDDALDPEGESSTIEIRDHIDAVLAGEDPQTAFEPSKGCTIKWRPDNEPDYWDRV